MLTKLSSWSPHLPWPVVGKNDAVVVVDVGAGTKPAVILVQRLCRPMIFGIKDKDNPVGVSGQRRPRGLELHVSGRVPQLDVSLDKAVGHVDLLLELDDSDDVSWAVVAVSGNLSGVGQKIGHGALSGLRKSRYIEAITIITFSAKTLANISFNPMTFWLLTFGGPARTILSLKPELILFYFEEFSLNQVLKYLLELSTKKKIGKKGKGSVSLV